MKTSSRPHLALLAPTPLPPPATPPAAVRAVPPLVPLLGPEAELTPELDRALTAAAHAAHAGDRAARDALYFALAPKIARFVARYARYAQQHPVAWEVADVAQEAFVVFADLVAAWQPGAAFGPYFLRAFPLRLLSAVHRLAGPRPAPAVALAPPRLALIEDGTAEATAAAIRLDALARDLPPVDGAILLGRVRDGDTFAAIAAHLGLDPRTVRRRWVALRAELRRSLTAGGNSIGE